MITEVYAISRITDKLTSEKSISTTSGIRLNKIVKSYGHGGCFPPWGTYWWQKGYSTSANIYQTSLPLKRSKVLEQVCSFLDGLLRGGSDKLEVGNAFIMIGASWLLRLTAQTWIFWHCLQKMLVSLPEISIRKGKFKQFITRHSLNLKTLHTNVKFWSHDS